MSSDTFQKGDRVIVTSDSGHKRAGRVTKPAPEGLILDSRYMHIRYDDGPEHRVWAGLVTKEQTA